MVSLPLCCGTFAWSHVVSTILLKSMKASRRFFGPYLSTLLLFGSFFLSRFSVDNVLLWDETGYAPETHGMHSGDKSWFQLVLHMGCPSYFRDKVRAADGQRICAPDLSNGGEAVGVAWGGKIRVDSKNLFCCTQNPFECAW